MGLANSGSEFEGTRHNAGGDAVRALALRAGADRLRPEKGQRALVAEVVLSGSRVVLCVSTAFMNDSGDAVRPLVRRYGIEDPRHLVVVHDDLDLPPGRVQVKVGGGLAGHRGLQSVLAHLGTAEFVRVRIGIGRPPGRQSGADYVLHRPGRADRALLDEAYELAGDAIETIAADGPDTAMNRCNGER